MALWSLDVPIIITFPICGASGALGESEARSLIRVGEPRSDIRRWFSMLTATRSKFTFLDRRTFRNIGAAWIILREANTVAPPFKLRRRPVLSMRGFT